MEASIYRLGFLVDRPSTLPPPTTFSARRDEILSKLEAPERPYVVFTIREADASYGPRDSRNRNIEDFLLSMRSLTKRGFNVIRLTSRSNRPLVVDDPHILDWQVLVDGREADELALISGAAFVISSTTGGDCLALAYRRPVFYIDSARLSLVFLATELATFQMPTLVDSVSSQKLTLREILARNLGWVGEVRSFDEAGVEIQNSDASRIDELVNEYVDLISQPSRESEYGQQLIWRRALLDRHGDVVERCHGEIHARMLLSSIKKLI